ncbi:prolycopene isomerase, chloroplastic-like protein [Corchorus olitorius]|uniref:Prolycopene isomerase, chloroplastic-like protein n=1 Tax=Corchorus olitorius TaxID=93759 RepID=A0A1R3KME0_9ROSI|nr:prolycopene isomerase, chloroplastic-like protein [Corchorus olitorius]
MGLPHMRETEDQRETKREFFGDERESERENIRELFFSVFDGLEKKSGEVKKMRMWRSELYWVSHHW